MPTYDYRCTACGHVFEAIHRIADPSPETCPACGDRAILKALVAPTFVFKGSGWAKKDRAAVPAKRSDGDSTGDSGAGDKGTADVPAAASSDGAAKDSASTGKESSSGTSPKRDAEGGSKTAAPAASD